MMSDLIYPFFFNQNDLTLGKKRVEEQTALLGLFYFLSEKKEHEAVSRSDSISDYA